MILDEQKRIFPLTAGRLHHQSALLAGKTKQAHFVVYLPGRHCRHLFAACGLCLADRWRLAAGHRLSSGRALLRRIFCSPGAVPVSAYQLVAENRPEPAGAGGGAAGGHDLGQSRYRLLLAGLLQPHGLEQHRDFGQQDYLLGIAGCRCSGNRDRRDQTSLSWF